MTTDKISEGAIAALRGDQPATVTTQRRDCDLECGAYGSYCRCRAEMAEEQQSRESAMVVLSRNAEGEPTVWCDPEIVDLVSALNRAGIRTVASCSGHGHRPGNIMLEDGRELIIARNFDEARVVDAIFPGINGEPPKVSLEELGLEK